MKAIVGALRVVLGMNSAAFDKGADAAEKRAKRLRKSMENIGKGMQRMGARMSAGVTAPLVALAYKSVDAMKVQERAVAAVDAALESMGDKAGFTRDQLHAMASELQGGSLYGDEEILSKVTANLLTFGNISGEVFKDTQQLALDLSARLGTDLQSSTVMLGKALNDPAKGLTALTRVGVSFTAEQQNMIKAMVKAGDVAGAQRLMIKALQEQYAGQAAAIAGTDSGRIQQAMMAIGDAMEKIGAIILPVVADIADHVKRWAEAFYNLDPRVQSIIVKVGALVAVIGPLIAGLGTMLILVAPLAGVFAAMTAPLFLAGAALVALAAGAAAVAMNWDAIERDYPTTAAGLSLVADAAKSVADRMLEAVKSLGTSGLQAFKSTLQAIEALVSGDWATLWESAKGLMSAAFEGMIATVDLFTVGGASALRDAVTGMISTIREFGPQLVTQGRLIVDWIASGIGAFIHRIPAKLSQLGTQIVAAIRSAAADVVAAARQLGVDPINGIPDRIASRIGAVKDAVASAVRGLIGVAEDEAEIRSPSRVFARIGQFLMQGLQVGIGAGTAGAVASMSDAAGQITDAVANGMDVSDAMQKMQTDKEAAKQRAADMFGTMGGWMADLIKGTATLGDKFRELGRNIAGSLRQSGLDGLGGAIGRAFGGGIGNFASSLLGGLLPFANGGSFKVGGAGGIDSQVVAFKASPDETVTVTRPDQAMGMAQMAPVRVFVETSEDLVARAEMAGAQQADVVYSTRRRAEVQSQRRGGLQR